MSKILILYAQVGGGHLSMALSLQSKLIEEGNEVMIIDVAGGVQVRFFESIYTTTTCQIPLVWNTFVRVIKINSARKLLQKSFELLTSQNIKKAINSFNPDKVISTYYFGGELVARNFGIDSVTVIPDLFTCHPIWFDSKEFSNHKYLVATEEASLIAKSMGAKNVLVTGFVFGSKFQSKMTQDQINEFGKSVGIEPNSKVILAAGGGSGFPKAEAFLREFLASNIQSQLIMVCGRDKNLQKKLTQIASSNHSKKIQILGFTNQMYEYLNCCDIVIAKAGPATVLECVSLGKPLFLYHYIWEQELGNKDWVIDNNLGIYEPDIVKLISKVEDWENQKIDFGNLPICDNIHNIINEVQKTPPNNLIIKNA